MSNSKITSKYQATIPKDIRDVLKLKPGDRITFEISINNKVFLRKANQFDLEYTRALNDTLSEWNSQEDEKDYEDL